MKRLGLSILFILVTLALLECGLRLFWQVDEEKSKLFRASSNKTLQYEHIPGAQSGVDIRINSHGFRDYEYPRKKPEGVKRIVVIGDSEIFSRHLALKETLPKQIETILNSNPEYLKQASRWDVLNMGMVGYTTVQELELLKTRGLEYAPDLALLHYAFNDPDQKWFPFHLSFYYHESFYYHDSFPFFLRHSRTSFYVARKVHMIRRRRDWKRLGIESALDYHQYLHTGPPWQTARNTLMEMADLCQSHGIPLVLVIDQPLTKRVLNFSSGYPYWGIHAKLLALKHPNLTVLDTISAFQEDGRDVSAYRHSAENGHKNALAHAMTARFISESLEGLGFL